MVSYLQSPDAPPADDHLRYPIGRFSFDTGSAAQRLQWISDIAALPDQLHNAVRGLTEAQLDTPYRPGGWTVRQVVHHVADSHINAYIRTKLALTEDTPTIKPYVEERWAELVDARTMPVDVSLTLIDSLHRRWVTLFRALRDEDLTRAFFHPEHQRQFSLEWIAAMYAWHGRHHAAHITGLRAQKNF